MSVVLGATVWPIERYETAPGAAATVGDRLSIVGDDVEVYPPENGVRFVTALGSELTALQSFMGWVDPYVDVLTCEQRFGDCDPSANREIQLGAMATAKEIAAYVAVSYLGLDATFTEGPAQVAGFDAGVCDDTASARRACRVLEVGDVITSIDIGNGAVTIDVVSDISEALAGARPGDEASPWPEPGCVGRQQLARTTRTPCPRSLVGGSIPPRSHAGQWTLDGAGACWLGHLGY